MSVTLSEAPGAGQTVTVTLAEGSDTVTGVDLVVTRPNPDDPTTPLTGFATIEIAEMATTGSTSATIVANEDDDGDPTDDTNYIHPRDKDVTITATAAGGTATYDPGEGTLQVREDDLPIGALTLTADPLGLSVDGTGGTTLTVGVPEEHGRCR